MKLGVVGTGKIVKEVLPFLSRMPLEKIVINGRERSREKTENLKEAFSLAETCYDYDELLMSDVDTVYIALPNLLHFSYAQKALRAGKNVILEKPVTVNKRQLEELIRLSRETGAMLFEALNIYSLPAYKKIQEEIKGLGRIRIVALNYSQYSSRYDEFKQGITAPSLDPAWAGGSLMDLNVYNIHFAAGLFGKPEKVDYFPNIERDIDTSGILYMQYPDFQLSAVCAKDCDTTAPSVIQFEQATLAIHSSVNFMTSFEITNRDGTKKEYDFEEGRHRLYYEFCDFIRMIEEKDYSSMEERLSLSLTAMSVLDEARQSGGIVFPEEAETIDRQG